MKIDHLIEKTTEKDGVKKWAVVLVIILGVVLAYFGLGLYLDFVGVNTYISETKQVVAVYDFYDLKIGETETAVYFIGSSIIGCGIDSDEINRLLREEGYDITVYNLGIDGNDPFEQSLQIQNIIDSKPSLVIFGETYNRLLQQTWNEEVVFLVNDRITLRPESLYLYTTDELWTILKPHTYLDDKRFVESAKKYSPKGIKQIDSVVSTDLYTLTKSSSWRHTEENNPNYKGYEGIVAEANSGGWSPLITDEMTNAKEAVIYNARTLMDAGIPVVILNMPLHPLISEHVTEESRENFFALLDSTGALWYDYEFACPDDEYWYKDGHHIAPETGAKMFAPQMAELIIELEESNVIHHS